ncbi:MAG: carboxylesterase family protein [Verrucomicrobiota bacterium]
MRAKTFIILSLTLLCCNLTQAQKPTSDIAYVENGHERQVLDIYTPETDGSENLPVVFWIHGGGWQAGDKSEVALKPKVLTERGLRFCIDQLSSFAGCGNGRPHTRRRQGIWLGP